MRKRWGVSRKRGACIRLIAGRGGYRMLAYPAAHRAVWAADVRALRVRLDKRLERADNANRRQAPARGVRRQSLPPYGAFSSATFAAANIASIGASLPVHISNDAAPWYMSIGSPPSASAPALRAPTMNGVCCGL